MEKILRFWELEFQGYTVGDFAVVVGILLLAMVARRVFQLIALNRLRAISKRTDSDIDDRLIAAVERPVGLLIPLLGFYVALASLRLPVEPVNVKRFFDVVILLLLALDLTWLLIRLTDVMAVFLQRMARKTDSTLDDQLIPLIRKSIKVAFAVLAFVLVVQNLGYKVTGLLAGLGIGGLAIALAAQSTLANLFGSVTIILDRPFRVGETVQGDGFLGTVEEIGLRSTRVRTFDRTLVTVPNSILANMTLDNWTQRPYRRAKFTVGVTYETKAEQMETAVEKIEEMLVAREDVLEESIVVCFQEFGDSSLDILVHFLTPQTAWADFLTVREEVNLEIMRILAALGLEVAFPTRTVYMRQEQSW